jgi:hypothetical protein
MLREMQKYAVLETKECTLRKYFEGKKVSHLNAIEHLTDYKATVDSRKYHDVFEDDRGYIEFHDSAMNRY